MADLKADGAPAEVIAELEASAGSAHFEVWPENWTVWRAFLACSTQWRIVAMQDGRIYWAGLDYAAADVVLRGSAFEITPKLWEGLRVAEAAARSCLNGVKVFDDGA